MIVIIIILKRTVLCWVSAPYYFFLLQKRVLCHSLVDSTMAPQLSVSNVTKL